jgi:CheY-like chemotaxis protein
MTASEGAIDREAPPLRILVVDDNRDAADSLCLLLRMWGFDVRVAYDGQEALTAAHAYRPDCLLSDIGLPGIDGYHLAQHVRRDEALRGITLVAITAYPDEARAKAAGFDHHFVKPADPQAVEEMLKEVAVLKLKREIEQPVKRRRPRDVPKKD